MLQVRLAESTTGGKERCVIPGYRLQWIFAIHLHGDGMGRTRHAPDSGWPHFRLNNYLFTIFQNNIIVAVYQIMSAAAQSAQTVNRC